MSATVDDHSATVTRPARQMVRVRVTSEYEVDAARWAAEYDLGDNTVAEDVASYLTSSEYSQDFPDWHRPDGICRTVSRRVEILPDK